jgi:hypothetical protein
MLTSLSFWKHPRLFVSCVILLLAFIASSALAITDDYTANPGAPLSNPYDTGSATPGPNPGTYGSFDYTYLNWGRALTADVYWYPAGGVSDSANLSTDSAGAVTGRELDITRNGGGTFTFKGLTLCSFTQAATVTFRGYDGVGTKIFDSGNQTINVCTGVGTVFSTYVPVTPWAGITELRVASTTDTVFDPIWDDFQYYLLPAPTVTSISPTSGLLAGGTSVAITGTGFVNGATVTIGGASATGVTWNSDTSISAVTPARTAGAKDVVVTNPDSQSGTLTGGFTYVAGPAITSATYDASTNALVVTGTGMTVTAGAANDIDVAKLTVTGQGGATYTLTSSNVEIGSATQFTVVLNAADQINVEGLLNKNGTSAVGGTTYNIAAAADWNVASTGNADLTGNGITVSNVQTPTIASATYDASTGSLTVTGANLVKASGATNDITANKLTLTGEGGATYTLTDTANVEITSGTAFTLTLSATDQAAANQMLNKNGTVATGGTTYNLAAADDWNTVITNGDISDVAGNGITVSNVAVPAITSATYDATTGALVVTGTGFLKLIGANNDIVANKFTITGEGGATYTLTDTVNVEITSGTSFTLTLSATDKAAINQILNKNGTASTGATTYNLAAAEDWTAGAAAGVTDADLTGNGITVSNVAVPAITSSTYDASTGAFVVTGTGFLSKSGATNDIVANKFTVTGEGGATYTLTDTANVEITSGTAFTLTLSATDKAAINQIINKNGTASTGGTTYNLAAAEDWTAGAAAGVTDADLVGNGITVSNVAVPAISSATYDYSSNILTVTGTGFLSRSGATNDIDLTKLTFTGEGGASYTLTNATGVEITSATSFAVTLSSADLTNVEALLNNNGTSAVSTTAYNLLAAAGWNRGDATNGADTTNTITVSNYAAPTVTSATFDASTSVLTVTGTNLVSKTGAANDVAVSLLTLTGEGGAYTLTSADVEISNATTFSVTLNAADQIEVRGLLNKNGMSSSSGTTYNLAAAEDWMAGTAGATVVADLTGNGITVSNVQTPTVTSATYDSDSGVLTVTGTNLFRKVGANNDIDLTKLTITGQGGAGAAYTLTSATGVEITSATSFTTTLTGADKTNVDALLNQIGTSANDSTTYNLAAADDWMAGADPAANIADATNPITVAISPKITSATYDATAGTLVVTGTNMQAKAGAVNDITASKLTVTGEGGITYTLTDTANVELTSATSFTMALSATDKAAINQIVNRNGTASTGGTTYSLAAADDWNAQVTAGNTADPVGNGITASNVPAPAITSSTYNAATGLLVVTGTGLLRLNGANNDIVANKFTLTGEGGATYTLTDTANVDITSGTAFTVALSATDRAAVNQIVNKNGTSSTGGTTYNLAAAEDWAAGADAAVVVADLAGNGITVSNVAVPTITTATYNAATGALAVTGTGFLKLNGAANDIVANKFTVTGEGGATYTLTDTANVEITSGTAFTLTLSATDKTAVNQIVNKNGTASTGATTYNLAAAEDWAAGADAAVVVADLAGNGITVSNVAVPAITSSTYDAVTGSLVVTGTGFLKLNGATNDIVANKFTVTGEGGATYALTDTANVEITSGTTFTITLSATDSAAVNQIVNKNGTASTGATTYNLAAAEDWAAGADAAVVVADVTGNGITVSNVAVPAITSSTYDAGTGALVVTGTGFLKLNGATNDIVANKFTVTGEGGATYTLTDTANVEITSGTSFTLALSTTDKVAVNQIVNKNGTSSISATTYNLAAAEDWAAGADAAVVVVDVTGNGITVSNVAVPTITSAGYNAATGVLVVTGTGLLKLSGANNDIVANMFTFTGQGGATYTLTDTANVEIASGTAFTLTLSATDRAAVYPLVNKNGTSSIDATTYNLAAAEDWAAGADAAVVVADLAGNGITVSNANTAPTFVVASTTLSVTKDVAYNLKPNLHVSDSDTGQTETWTQSVAPTHGALTFTAATAASGSVNITPGGSISYTPTAGYTGSDSFTVQVSDGVGGSATRSFTVTVSVPPVIIKTTPTITWGTPAAITAGTPLSATQLNATATVSGSFSYTPPVGTILGAGTRTLSVSFTPDDAINYDSAFASVTIAVLDLSPPTVTSFTISDTSDALTVPLLTFTATDNVGVSGYLLSESASQPQVSDSAWSASIPASYIFASQGVKTLYAFAKDAAGNISAPATARVAITLADTIAPIMDSFTIPATADSLVVAITSLTASDTVGVTSWLLSESAIQPAADDTAWSATKPAGYTFATQGAKTLYAFAKDAAANISAPLSAGVTITLADTVAPSVDSFIVPATATALTVPVTTLSASDTVGVAAWYLSESATQPPANDAAWSATVPVSYTFDSQGTKTLYAFAKDAAGNISAPAPATVTITMADSIAPTVTAFTIPATATSLTVAVSTFTASDITGVTGYLISETATASAADSRWTTSTTNSYTFSTAGAKTLYAFARDGAGNISAPAMATVIVTLADTSAPAITLFTMPTGTVGLTAAITDLSATDNSAVTGFYLSESATAPDVAAPVWTSTRPAAYTFSSTGNKTLYAYAKDAAGNISAPATASVTVTLPDTSAPTVTVFTVPAASGSLTVPVTTLTASDDTAVTGYLVTEAATASASDSGWSTTIPASFTFGTEGSKTLYAFAKDGAGNISAPAPAHLTITLPIIIPVVNGVCGSANNSSFTIAPTTNLCSSGSASSVTGSGPWSWSCNGLEGGSSATCQASATIPPVTTFSVTPSAGAGSSISPSGVQSINQGATTSFTVTATPGFGILTVTGCGGTLNGSAYTTAAISGNCSVSVTAIERTGTTGGGSSPPTIADALRAFNAFAGGVQLTPEELIRYDVAPLSAGGIPQGNGVVDFGDIILILRRSIGIGNW